MTCDQVHELLPDHLLGTLEGPEDLEVRRHLRGCAACRSERGALEEGMAAFSRATHDRLPPPELRARVLGTLADEWTDPAAPATLPPPRALRRRGPVLVAAAVVAILAISGVAVWGTALTRRVQVAEADAVSYRNLLATLGGQDFRVGTLQVVGDGHVDGRVLLYDGDPGLAWSSWGMVLVHTQGTSGDAAVTLSSPDGRTLEFPPLHLVYGKSASTWLTTDKDLTPYDRLTIHDADGRIIATASITSA